MRCLSCDSSVADLAAPLPGLASHLHEPWEIYVGGLVLLRASSISISNFQPASYFAEEFPSVSEMALVF